MKKEKTKCEINRDLWRFFACIVVILLALFIIYAIIIDGQKLDLQKQLQECQEKIPVWTLKYNCDWSAIEKNFTGYYEFKNYEDYLEKLDFVENILECRVIR